MADWQRKPLEPVDFLGRSGDNVLAGGSIELHELGGLELVHVAVQRERLPQLIERLQDSVGLAWPEPGRFVASRATAAGPSEEPLRMMWLAPDQCMVLAPRGSAELARVIESIEPFGHVTDQSDNWVAVNFAGELAVPALERICPLDLHISAMPHGSAARTVMEHLAVIIARVSDDGFVLLSPSSSAHSFRHALVTSVANLGD